MMKVRVYAVSGDTLEFKDIDKVQNSRSISGERTVDLIGENGHLVSINLGKVFAIEQMPEKPKEKKPKEKKPKEKKLKNSKA